MDEFGETPQIYVWIKYHVEGDPIPVDFWDRVTRGLASEGLEWEAV